VILLSFHKRMDNYFGFYYGWKRGACLQYRAVGRAPEESDRAIALGRDLSKDGLSYEAVVSSMVRSSQTCQRSGKLVVWRKPIPTWLPRLTAGRLATAPVGQTPYIVAAIGRNGSRTPRLSRSLSLPWISMHFRSHQGEHQPGAGHRVPSALAVPSSR
jgi:hypothetical protein